MGLRITTWNGKCPLPESRKRIDILPSQRHPVRSPRLLSGFCGPSDPYSGQKSVWVSAMERQEDAGGMAPVFSSHAVRFVLIHEKGYVRCARGRHRVFSGDEDTKKRSS